jgi:hypothetical protein
MDSHEIAASKGSAAAAFSMLTTFMSWLAQTIVENNTLILTIIPMITCVATVWYFINIIKLRRIEVLSKPETNQKTQTPDQ